MERYYQRKTEDGFERENIFWTTLADLMLGLAIIFITLFVLAITGFSQQSLHQQKIKMDVSKEIEQGLNNAKINAHINNMTGDLEIPSVELFALNSFTLTPEGKKILDKIAPIYINTVFSNSELTKQIESIHIQGHTDSQTFAGINSKDEQYLKNMDLSLKRANAVAAYILQTNYNKQNAARLKKMLYVEGRSYSDPVLINGKEDYDRSRRVEIKLKVKDWDIGSALGLKK